MTGDDATMDERERRIRARNRALLAVLLAWWRCSMSSRSSA